MTEPAAADRGVKGVRHRSGADPGEYPFGRAVGSFFAGCTAAALPRATPLLAYGANASPEMLSRKLPGVTVAGLAGRLRGWRVVHSAHVSPYGAVPVTLVADPDAEEPVHVLLVAGALDTLDATEPNYDRVALGALDLQAEHIGHLDAAEAYISRHGPLLVRGRPVPLGALGQAELRAALTP